MWGFKSKQNRRNGTSTQSNSTVLNQATASTVINPDTTAQSSTTRINPNIQDQDSTKINTSVQGNLETEELAKSNDTLLGKYKILSTLEDTSGEADLFVCECKGQQYMAKIYRRTDAIKPEVVKHLMGIQSPYVGKIIEFGDYNGRPVEIQRYYKNGNMTGRKFSFDDIKKWIVPQLNEALKTLHENDILHKDIKPANIMIGDDGKTAVLIDFGISSVREGGSTVVVTMTGMTPDYTAPEALQGLWLKESDYYSLGITLYELFTGATPFNQMTQQERERMLIVQNFPLPDSMPQELRELITGLTYRDITHRNEPNNPNRRWTYNEVKKWCEGIRQALPGIAAGRAYADDFEPIMFERRKYTSYADLIEALGKDWEKGKRFFYEGDLSYAVKHNDPELRRKLIQLENEAEDGGDKIDKDVQFFRMFYVLDSHFTRILWKGNAWDDLSTLGRDVMKRMAAGDKTVRPLMQELLQKKILSAYLDGVGDKDRTRHDAIAALETQSSVLSGNTREDEKSAWALAYMLSGEKVFLMDGERFEKPSDISAYMLVLLDESQASFDRFCNKLLPQDGELNAQFESWLIALGYENEIEEWRNTPLFA